MASLLTHFVARRAHKTGILNLSEGFRLLRDRQVPVRSKLLALGLGLLLTAILAALEVPLEAVVAFLLPFLGTALDIAVDGIEFLILPLLFAAIVIQRLHRDPWPDERNV